MDIALYGTTGVSPEVDNESALGQLEFSLAIREVGKNLPLGADGGATGLVEFVGIDSKGAGTDTNTPVGGVTLNHDTNSTFSTVEWTFVDANSDGAVDGVDVTVNGGTAVRKSISASRATASSPQPTIAAPWTASAFASRSPTP